jgi:hypothetical protein
VEVVLFPLGGKPRWTRQCLGEIKGRAAGKLMTHVRLEILYAEKGGGNLERLEASFTACASYAIWVTSMECYKHQLIGMLNKCCDSVLGTVSPIATYQNLVNTRMGSVRTQ